MPPLSANTNGDRFESHDSGLYPGIGRTRILGPDGLPYRADSPEADFVVGHPIQFSSLLSSGFRAYWHGRYDEAIRDSRENALAMRNDAFLMALLQERKLATASLRYRIEVDDERDPMQQAVQEGLLRIIRRIPNFRKMVMYLLESIWYGRYAAQIVWGWAKLHVPSYKDPKKDVERKCLVVKNHLPVNGDKIGYHWDGTPYISVNPAFSSSIPNADITPTTSGAFGLYLRGSWRWRYIVHAHEAVDADYFDSEAADAIHGLGIRSVIYWMDWLRKTWLGNIADWCERIGLGIRLWYYQANNPESKKAVEKAAKESSAKTNIVIPRYAATGGKSQEGVEFVDIGSQSGAGLLLKLQQHLEEIIERYVIGQSLSGGRGSGDSLGGEGKSKLAKDTKSQIIQYDAGNLGETLTSDLLRPIQHWTFNEPAARAVNARFVFAVDEPEPEKLLAAVKTFVVDLGGKVRMSEVQSVIGLGAVHEGDEVISLETIRKQQGQAGPGGPGGAPPGGGPPGALPGMPPAAAGGAPPGPGGPGEAPAPVPGGAPAAAAAEAAGGAGGEPEPGSEDQQAQGGAPPAAGGEQAAAGLEDLTAKGEGAMGAVGPPKKGGHRHYQYLGSWQRRISPLRYAWEPHRHPRDLKGRFVKGMQGHAIGDLKHVGGLPVRRHGEDWFSVDTDKGHVKGTADEIAEHIVADHERRRLEGKPWHEALSRTEGWTEPDAFADPRRAEHEAEGFAKLKKGARVVSLNPDTIGRMGTVVKDKEGNNSVKMDTTGEVVSSVAWEPLNKKQSWRIEGMPAGPAPKQRGLFDEDEEEAPPAKKPAPKEEPVELPAPGKGATMAGEAETEGFFKAPAEQAKLGFDKAAEEEPAEEPVKAGKLSLEAFAEWDKYFGKHVGSYKTNDFFAHLMRFEDDPAKQSELARYFKAKRPDQAAWMDSWIQPIEAPAPEEKPPAAEKPEGFDPLDLNENNLRAVWEANKAEIEASDKKLSPNAAGSIAAARIRNMFGDRADKFIADVDARVRRGEEISEEEDEKYIAAGEIGGRIYGQLVSMSGYRPGTEHDDDPRANQPLVGPGAAAEPEAEAPAEEPAEKPKEAAHPRLTLADDLEKRFRAGEQITAKSLLEYADKAYGGTRAEGAHDPSGVYDSMEAGFNKSLKGETDPTKDLKGAIADAEAIKAKVDALPTQTNRSGKKVSMQQFSTPPHYAYAVAWLANLQPGELVGEPSAGTGCLAMQAQNAGAKLVTNEYDPDRAMFLKDQFGAENVSLEDGEQLGAIWPKRGIRPTAIMMNPPFSQTAGRMGDKMTLMTGANHVTQALQALAPGGRLVAIVGGGFQRTGGGRAGMAPESPTYSEWFRKLAANGYQLRANVGVAGDEYKKFGTHFGTRVLVIDKTNEPAEGIVPTGDVESIPDLMRMLQEVRDDRREISTEPSSEHAGGGLPEGAGPGGPGEADADDRGAVGAPSDDDAIAGAGGHGDSGRADPADPSEGNGSLGGGDGELAGGRPEYPGPGAAEDGAGEGVAGPEGAPGPAPRKRKKRGGGGGGGGGGRRRGDKSLKRIALNVPQLVFDQLGSLRDAKPVTFEEAPEEAAATPGDQSQLGTNVYEPYKPSYHIKGMHEHITPLVESAAMAAVKLPKISYRPHLSPDAVENYKAHAQLPDGSVVETNLGLSEAGLETVCLMGQAHSQWLPAAGGGDTVIDGKVYTNRDGQTFVAKFEDGKWHLDRHGARRQADGRIVVDPVQPERRTFRDQEEIERVLGQGWDIGIGHGGPTNAVLRFKPRGQAYRMGALNGDGTGSGKGRSVAGVILDNVNQGRMKHVWMSKNFGLMEDARRDMADVGLDPKRLFNFKELMGENPPKDGICFIPYTTLSSGTKPTGDTPSVKNLDVLVDWLGNDFEGVIAMDEAHAMANSTGGTGSRGVGKPAAMALAGIALQAAVPKARVGYWTATAATEPSNLLYCDRLGLWGPGTDFPEKVDFVAELGEGGNATLEAVAQSMKAMGMYNARLVAMDDGTGRQDKDGRYIGRIETEPLSAKLSDDQKMQYDGAAEGWQHVMRKIDEITEHLGGPEKSAKSQFWGAQQRFFNQTLTCMAMPSTLAAIDEDLAVGRAPVIQLVNTMLASQDRVTKNRDEDTELDEIDVGPKEILLHFIEKSFPTHRIEEYVPDPVNNPDRVYRPVRTAATAGPAGVTIGAHHYPPGATIPRDLLESAVGQDIIGGELVQDEHALAEKQRLKDQAEALRIPESPLDQLIHKYGHNVVSEITGRDERFIWDERGKKVIEKRSKASRDGDVSAFQDGRKQILVFSGAGNTGKSYHADRRAKNQGRRTHYVLQPGWSATPLVQSLGRTNRANQTTYPIIRPVGIPEVPGNKRFISSAARRLESQGALTRGQRQATGGGGAYGATDNLETPEAVRGLHAFWFKMQAGQIPDVPFEETLEKLGYSPYNDEGEAMEPPKITQFLNRILILKLEEQNRVFDAFEQSHRAIVEQAIKENTLDRGVENWKADRIEHAGTETIYTHPTSGATAQLITVKSHSKVNKRDWSDNVRGMDRPLKFVQNQQSGKVWAVYESTHATDADTGRVYPTYMLKGIQGQSRGERALIDHSESNYKEVPKEEAEAIWQAEYDKTPELRVKDDHFVTGAFLPVWKKLAGKADEQIFRLKMDTGRTVVGRYVHPDKLQSLLRTLGVHRESKKHDPAAIHAALEAGELKHIKFGSDWKVRPSKAGAGGRTRLELIGPSIYDREILAQGVVKEYLGGRQRFFIPAGAGGAQVMVRLAEHRPITEVVEAESEDPGSERLASQRGGPIMRYHFVRIPDSLI